MQPARQLWLLLFFGDGIYQIRFLIVINWFIISYENKTTAFSSETQMSEYFPDSDKKNEVNFQHFVFKCTEAPARTH